MYPWKAPLSLWANSTRLRIDALGLVTLLGADEINACVGRLVKSRFLDYLPLLGAFVIANNSFTLKTPGFTLYNISSGFTTTELAGWLSRWLQAQDFHQVHSKVTWAVGQQPARHADFWLGCLLIGFPSLGMLIALTVLSADWWGFANAVAMEVSVVVRLFLLSQNRAAIDNAIADADSSAVNPPNSKPQKYPGKDKQDVEAKPAASPEQLGPSVPLDKPRTAKMIVIMDDSKVVTMIAPDHLVPQVFAGNPQPPNPWLYALVRWIGWLAFGVHILSIGMADLATQICTVFLLVLSTILTVSKIGCEDSRVWRDFKTIGREVAKHFVPEKPANQSRDGFHTYEDSSSEITCWITTTLKASCSVYPSHYEDWEERVAVEDFDAELKNWVPGEDDGLTIMEGAQNEARIGGKSLSSVSQKKQSGVLRTNRRQDLWVWLNLQKEELESMKMWNLFPHSTDRTKKWWSDYYSKRKYHTDRLRARTSPSADAAKSNDSGPPVRQFAPAEGQSV